MTVMDNEDPADPSVHEPRVTDSPEAIWLVYGDIEQDSTHSECCASGEVLWCEDAQFQADVSYTRTDLVAERVRAAAAAERERWTGNVCNALAMLRAGDSQLSARMLAELVGAQRLNSQAGGFIARPVE